MKRALLMALLALLPAACAGSPPSTSASALPPTSPPVVSPDNQGAAPAGGCEMLDRKCWEAKRAGVVGPRGDGYNSYPLADRNRFCVEMLDELEKTAQGALAHLYARDQVFSPSGRGVDYDNPTGGVGYIDHGYVHEIEREINTIVAVTVRDVRTVRYDGADVYQCASLVHDAQGQIEQIRAALP